MHVWPERMRELFKGIHITEHPEWQHIKTCKECCTHFLELLDEWAKEKVHDPSNQKTKTAVYRAEF